MRLSSTGTVKRRSGYCYWIGIEFDANDASWYNLGVAYQRLDRLEQAAAAYDRAVKLSPHNPGYRATRENFGK
jgi:tetratricopeptide (TPR) repeat protein